MIQALSRVVLNLTSSYRLLLLNTARARQKFQEWVRCSAGNKLVSEWVLSQMMRAVWIDYGVGPACSGNESLLEQCADGSFAPHAPTSAEYSPGARYVTGERTSQKQSNQNALRNRMEELGLSICPPNIVARPPNAHLFNYQISWIPCGFLLPLRGRRSFSPANSCVSDV